MTPSHGHFCFQNTNAHKIIMNKLNIMDIYLFYVTVNLAEIIDF